MIVHTNLNLSEFKDNGTEVHSHQCIDELQDRISSALKEIYVIWSMNNLSCRSVKDALKEDNIDLEQIAEKLEDLAYALKESTIEPKLE